MFSKQPIVVQVLRGPVVESTHDVLAAVVNENGQLIHSWGNAQYLTFPRSAIKMLQAIPFVESGAVKKYALEDKHIALACASHRGEKAHLEALAKWMELAKISESNYVCGPHLPFNQESAHEFIRRNQKPTVLCNNCAGKHSGIITTCLHLGESPQGYENPEHNAQKRLRQVLTEVMQYDHSKTSHGVDGCGIPTYAAPLQAIATGMSVFINPKIKGPRKEACDQIMAAVVRNPFYISGSDEFSTVVIEKTHGRVVLKGGAEGVVAGVIPHKKVAFALKCSDGADRGVELATMQLLLQLGGMTVEEAKSIPEFSQPVVKNWKGDVVGQLRIAKPS